jgi:competence ComEA-like helix-hairpin-helix protein
MGASQVTRRTGSEPSWAAKWLWLLTPLIPFGWFAFAGFLYAGLRVRHAPWMVAGVVYLVVTGVTFGLIGNDDPAAGAESSRSGVENVAITVMLVFWLLSIVHALVIRKEFVRRLELRAHVEDDQLDRRLAHEIAAERPGEAHELGIGRPDVPGAQHGGLVDVNNASAEALATLPGIGTAAAHGIVALREEAGGFSSVEELGMVADLPADTVERLRGRVLFLPRA